MQKNPFFWQRSRALDSRREKTRETKRSREMREDDLTLGFYIICVCCATNTHFVAQEMPPPPVLFSLPNPTSTQWRNFKLVVPPISLKHTLV